MGFEKFKSLSPEAFLETLPYIAELWKDTGLQTAYDRRREFQLVSGIHNFYF